MKVQAPDDEAIVSPVVPLVANDPANQIVLSADRSPPPARADPAFIALDDETAVIPKEKVAVLAL